MIESRRKESPPIVISLFELPHEVEPWFHSWYRSMVETLDAKYHLSLNCWCGHMKWSQPWFHFWYRGRVETLDAKYKLLVWPHEVEPHEIQPWFHSWYRGRVDTLNAISYFSVAT